jgi:hypothetical protein
MPLSVMAEIVFRQRFTANTYIHYGADKYKPH